MDGLQRERVKNQVIHYAYMKYFYFNEEGIYSSLMEKEVTVEQSSHFNYPNGIYFHKDGRPYTKILEPSVYGCYNKMIARMALSRLQEGDTLERFAELLETCKPLPPYSHKVEGIERFVAKVERPDFRRRPENHDENTFDYIRLKVCVVTEYAMKNRDAYLKENIREITKHALKKMQEMSSFQRYGVSIRQLKIESSTFKKKTSTIEYMLGKKEM